MPLRLLHSHLVLVSDHQEALQVCHGFPEYVLVVELNCTIVLSFHFQGVPPALEQFPLLFVIARRSNQPVLLIEISHLFQNLYARKQQMLLPVHIGLAQVDVLRILLLLVECPPDLLLEVQLVLLIAHLVDSSLILVQIDGQFELADSSLDCEQVNLLLQVTLAYPFLKGKSTPITQYEVCTSSISFLECLDERFPQSLLLLDSVSELRKHVCFKA